MDLWAGMSKHEHRGPLAVQGRLRGRERGDGTGLHHHASVFGITGVA